jgi:hypothetical protein
MREWAPGRPVTAAAVRKVAATAPRRELLRTSPGSRPLEIGTVPSLGNVIAPAFSFAIGQAFGGWENTWSSKRRTSFTIVAALPAFDDVKRSLGA